MLGRVSGCSGSRVKPNVHELPIQHSCFMRYPHAWSRHFTPRPRARRCVHCALQHRTSYHLASERVRAGNGDDGGNYDAAHAGDAVVTGPGPPAWHGVSLRALSRLLRSLHVASLLFIARCATPPALGRTRLPLPSSSALIFSRGSLDTHTFACAGAYPSGLCVCLHVDFHARTGGSRETQLARLLLRAAVQTLQ